MQTLKVAQLEESPKIDLSPPKVTPPKGPSNYTLNKGKAFDTLRKDYQYVFERPLDFSIYTNEIQVTDPSGIAFQGK